jgi:hypothetical protein
MASAFCKGFHEETVWMEVAYIGSVAIVPATLAAYVWIIAPEQRCPASRAASVTDRGLELRKLIAHIALRSWGRGPGWTHLRGRGMNRWGKHGGV